MTDHHETDDQTAGAAGRIDELLSAHLDGELEAARQELGVTDAEVAVVASDSGRDRTEALARAARAIGQIERLDELTRARLVRSALATEHAAPAAVHPSMPPQTSPRMPTAPPDELTPRRARKKGWAASVGAAAAAIALLAGIGVALQNGGDGRNDDRAALAEPGDESSSAPGALDDYGELSDPARLRELLEGSASALDSAGGAESDSDGKASYDDTSAAAPSADAASTTVETGRDADPAACLAPLNPGGPVPALVGSATFEGAPALVAVLELSDRTLAWVLAADDCRILAAQSLAKS